MLLMISSKASNPRESELTNYLPDNPKSNEAVRNLVIDYINLAIF